MVQSDGRLVEDVADATQVGAELRGQADALRLAARERRRRAVERQVAQADLLEEIEPAIEFRHEVSGDFSFSSLQKQFGNKTGKTLDGHPAKIRNALPSPL